MEDTQTLLGDVVAWDNRRLVITSPDAVARLRRPALSPSTAKSLSPKSCAASWAIDKLLPSGPENPFDPAPLGTSAHALLEDFYQLAPAARTLVRFNDDLRAAAWKMWPDHADEPNEVRAAVRDNRHRWAAAVRAVSETIFAMEDPTQVDVYATEMKFDGIEVNGVPAIGYIDRVDNMPDGGIKPIDYKSGKEEDLAYGDAHGDQLRIYAEVARLKTGVMPTAAQVYYTKTGNIREVDISKRAMDDTLGRFSQSWDRHNRFLDNAEFTLKDSALCGWCPAVNSCPVAAEKGKKDRKGDAPTAVALGIPTLRNGLTPTPAQTAHDFDLDFPPEDVSGSVSDLETSAHMDGEAGGDFPEATENLEENAMRITEGRPYEDPITVEGELDPNNYAALGAFAITQMAVESLHNAGRGLSGREVSSLAHTFSWVIARAQENWIGEGAEHNGFALGSHSRLRGVLRTVIETLPLPFGQDEAGWADWAEKAVKRSNYIVRVSLDVFSNPVSDDPWARLAGGAPAATAPVAATPAPAPVEAPKAKRAPAKRAPAKPKPAPVAEPVVEPTPEPVAATPEPTPVTVPPAGDYNYDDDYAFED